jgi:hypothetical protein
MDNVQKHTICVNVPTSETFTAFKHFMCLEKVWMLCDNGFAKLTSKSSLRYVQYFIFVALNDPKG